MLPNTKYLKVHLIVEVGTIAIISFKVNEETRKGSHAVVDSIDEYFLITEYQYKTIFQKIVEAHIKAGLRRDIEKYELGHEVENEEDWDLIEGHLVPKDFFMWSVPYHSVKITEELYTDHNGNLIRKEGTEDGRDTV